MLYIFQQLKKYAWLFVFFVLALSAVSQIKEALAAEPACVKDAKVIFNGRNYKGEFIPDLSFALYKQVVDAYGKPKPGTQVYSGKVDSLTGFGTATLKSLSGTFALKVWQKNPDVGVFWFYNEVKVGCGETVNVMENLSSINFVFRNPDGELKKNTKFKVYTQRQDVDGNPIKEKQDLVVELDTSSEGTATLYVAENVRSVDGNGSKYYSFESTVPGGSFLYWGIKVAVNKITTINYVFSDLIIQLQDASGKRVALKDVDLYKQTLNLKGEYILGSKLTTKKTDENGLVRFEYPYGDYAISVKDSLDQANPFYEIKVIDQDRQNYSLTTNYTRIAVENFNIVKASLNVYSMNQDVEGLFYRVSKLKAIPFTDEKFIDLSLTSDPYLFAMVVGDKEYGKALYTVNNKYQEILIKNDPAFLIDSLQRFRLEVPPRPKPSTNSNLPIAERLKGFILLQVEAHGEAWYVDPKTKLRYYMKDGEAAYQMLRKFGLGITDSDLRKISVGLDDRFKAKDTDADGLADKLEDGLGTNRNLKDTDGDTYTDGQEIIGNFDPLVGGGQKLPIDLTFSDKLKGKILLQVQAHGEAWYIHPNDGRRYFLPDGENAYQIMRFLSLGISNADLNKIPIGKL